MAVGGKILLLRKTSKKNLHDMNNKKKKLLNLAADRMLNGRGLKVTEM